MVISELQRNIIATVEREMHDQCKALQIDGIIECLVAAYGEASRKQITELVIGVVRAKGAVAIWTARS